MSRLLGGRKTHATSRSATRNRSTDLSPWPCRQLACLCAHAYTDTNEEPTMTLLSSKIERPPTRTLSGTAWMPAKHCSYLHNTPPPPFTPPPASPDRRWWLRQRPPSWAAPANTPSAHGGSTLLRYL